MNIKKLLLGTAVASGVMIVAVASEPAFPVVNNVKAAVSVSVEIGFNVFYDRLARHGDWITFHNRYVWVPRVDIGWRPYFHGHWVYTRTYGWYWLSDEPFAWAAYHYGRWAFDPAIGWYWIPGRRWAPAWVVWSHTDNEIAWAPLPPDYDDNVSVSISVSSVPVYYWQAVPVAFFVSIDLNDHVIRDRDHIRRIVSSGEPKTVIVQNNVVINNVIDIDVIEQKSKEKVVVYEEKPAKSPEAAGVAEGNAVAVFNPQVKEEPQARPAKLKKVDQVAAEKKASGTLPQEPAATTVTPAQPVKPSSAEAETPPSGQGKPKAHQAGAEKKKRPTGQAASETEAAPEQGQAVTSEQPPKKQKKKAVGTEQPATVQQQTKQPAGAVQQAEQPVRKQQKKKAVVVEQPATAQQQAKQPAGAVQQQAELPVKKHKGSEKALKAQPEEGTAPAAEGKQAQKPEKKQGKKKCDPAVEGCAGQQ